MTTSSVRELVGENEQGVNEKVSYWFDTTPWNAAGATPSSVAVTVYDVTDGGETSVTSTVMPTNSPTVSGTSILLSPLKSLTDGKTYRVYIKFTVSGNDLEPYKTILARR